MKLLSVAIPCYNSEAYMANCIESLLVGGEEVEIIVVNDGSKDRTAEIAEEYRVKYPTIVKVVNKENGGHGSAVNAGLENATGLYFKVVDSDDWVDKDAYKEILDSGDRDGVVAVMKALQERREMLYEKNSHTKLKPASMTKMMGLYLVMESLNNNLIKLVFTSHISNTE